ncbi:hypothetical protein KI387_001710, partial [Taxus chinensis]
TYKRKEVDTTDLVSRSIPKESESKSHVDLLTAAADASSQVQSLFPAFLPFAVSSGSEEDKLIEVQ